MADSAKRFLVTGASGQLGSYVVRELQKQNLPFVAWSHRPNAEVLGVSCQSVDIRDPDSVRSAFATANPAMIIHAAAMSGVGDCFRDSTCARQTNANGTKILADLARQHSARMVYVSTDLVFDGRRGSYRETDCPSPLSVYGHTKTAAERTVLNYHQHLVVRISLLFGPSINGRPSFFNQQIQTIQAGASITLFEDEWRTPVSLQTAARGLIEGAQADVTGILHLGGPERMSRLEMGQRLARLLGKNESGLRAAGRDDLPAAEPRPRDTSLNSDIWYETFPSFPRTAYEESLRELGLS